MGRQKPGKPRRPRYNLADVKAKQAVVADLTHEQVAHGIALFNNLPVDSEAVQSLAARALPLLHAAAETIDSNAMEAADEFVAWKERGGSF